MKAAKREFFQSLELVFGGFDVLESKKTYRGLLRRILYKATLRVGLEQ